MKKMKKILALLMSLVMIFSTMTVIGADETTGTDETAEVTETAEEVVPTEVSQWKENGITAPKEGKLVGAGYIDIKYYTTLEDAESYQVYFDGELVEDLASYREVSDTISACEVYTTEVSGHTAKVVAVIDAGNVETETLTFYVSKKGLAMGSDMSDVVNLSKLNLSWYYNWDTVPLESGVADGIDLVPMIWGKGNVEDEDGNSEAMSMEEYEPILQDYLDSIDPDTKYVLGYNEPDIASQANMTVDEGLHIWSSLQTEGRRTVSPAPADPNGTSAWLASFIEGIDNDDDLNCDAIALHWYQTSPNVDNVLKIVDSLYEKYNRPIWFTEISVVGYNKTYSDNSYQNEESRKKVQDFLTELIEGLEERDYVERYAWFPYNINSANEIDSAAYSGASAMFDYDTGEFTELGRIYSNIGNPEGYDAEVITDDEMYVEKEEETTAKEQEETTVGQAASSGSASTNASSENTVSTNTDSTTVEKTPAQVKVKKVKNVKKKSIKVKWKKANNAVKYQIQYSTSKKFKTKKTKTKTTGKVTYKIKKLKKKKTYYIRVRGVNKNKYGKWSKVEKVKVRR